MNSPESQAKRSDEKDETVLKENQYRKLIQDILSKEYKENGKITKKISNIYRQTIKIAQENLDISEQKAKTIESEIVESYQNYYTRLQNFEKLLKEEIDKIKKNPNQSKKIISKVNQCLKVWEIDNQTGAIIYSKLGESLYQQDQLTEALLMFEEATNLNLTHIEGYLGSGMILYQQNKREEALEKFKIAKILLKQNETDEERINYLENLINQLENLE